MACVFTGKERDAESGLDYFGARFLSSATARFTSVDPSRLSVNQADPQSWNRYTYALNNPLAYLDPNGKWTTGVHEWILDQAFGKTHILSQSQVNTLKAASAAVDRDQSPEGAYKHGMSSPGQQPGEAMAKTQAYIDSKISEAVSHQMTSEEFGLTPNGELAASTLYSLGEALHAVTDRVSPQHTGAQVWFGLNLAYSDYAASHYANEKWSGVFDRADQMRAVAEAQRAYRQFLERLEEARRKAEKEKKEKEEQDKPKGCTRILWQSEIGSKA